MSTYKALLAFHVGNLLIRDRFDSEGDSREEMPSKSVLSPLSDEFAKTEAVYQEGGGNFISPNLKRGGLQERHSRERSRAVRSVLRVGYGNAAGLPV